MRKCTNPATDALLITHAGLAAANGKDGTGAGGQHSVEAVDAEHAEVGDGEVSGAVLVRGELQLRNTNG